MFRLVAFVAFLALAALGFAWLADRPGTIAIDWLGQRIETTAFAAAVALTALVLLTIALYQVGRYLVHGPEAFVLGMRLRKRERGLKAVGRGLVAVGAGDTALALKAANEAERTLGLDPMTLLLRSQAAQLSGDRKVAQETFERMLDNPDTRALGLRGLYVEATRAGEADAARRYAEAAVATRAAIPWAANAVLAFQAGGREWDEALETIRRNADNRLIDRAHAKRLKAVVLTAQATEAEATDRARAKALALEAHGLAPDLVPAAVLAARLSSEGGDVKRATRVIEATWRLSPHPDLADAYTHARMGDAARDRLKRARALEDLAPRHPESAFAVASAALEARDFAAARAAMAPLLDAPTRRTAMLMAMLAEGEGNVGEAREWLARVATAAADPVWTADGFVSDRWLPMSPVSAKLDAFEWKVPVEAAPGSALPTLVMPVVPEPVPVPEPPRAIAPAPAAPAPPDPAPTPLPAPAPAPAEAGVSNVRPIRSGPPSPDDPGPEPKADEAKRRRFGVF